MVLAIQNFDYRTAELLLQHGASPDLLATSRNFIRKRGGKKRQKGEADEKRGTTVLHAISKLIQEHNKSNTFWKDIVELLVKYNADVNILDQSRNSPLHLFAERNCIPGILALLFAGKELSKVEIIVSNRY